MIISELRTENKFLRQVLTLSIAHFEITEYLGFSLNNSNGNRSIHQNLSVLRRAMNYLERIIQTHMNFSWNYILSFKKSEKLCKNCKGLPHVCIETKLGRCHVILADS